MAMSPKDVVDICMPRRDKGDRLIGLPIIELEFEKDTLDPHIIIGGVNISSRQRGKPERENRRSKNWQKHPETRNRSGNRKRESS